jgi:hypothetical protein
MKKVYVVSETGEGVHAVFSNFDAAYQRVCLLVDGEQLNHPREGARVEADKLKCGGVSLRRLGGTTVFHIDAHPLQKDNSLFLN